MIQLLDTLFGAPGLIPRGEAMGWDPGLVRLHVVSDAVSAFSYLVLPAAILIFLLRRRDFDPDARRLGWLLIGFIVAGSLTHLAALLTMWVPAYGLQGALKAATAVMSLAAAVLVWPQLPKLLALPSPGDLRRANAALAQTNASLETTIAWRTHELDQTRKRFENALARSNITVSAQDRDLRYTYIFNPALGLAPEDVVGRTEAEILPGEAAAETAELKRRALEQGQTVSDTIAVTTPNDGVVYLDLTVSPTHAFDGSIDGVLSMTADVTEKRLFEVRLAAMAAQIAAAYRRLELALENSPITVFEQDADLRYAVIHNPPPGTTADDFVGRTDAEVFSEADQRRIVPPKRRVLERKARERLEVEIEVAGARRYYDLILEPKLDAGRQGGGRDRHRPRSDRAPAERAADAPRHARADPSLEEPARGHPGHGAQDREPVGRHRQLRGRLLRPPPGDGRGAGPARRARLVGRRPRGAGPRQPRAVDRSRERRHPPRWPPAPAGTRHRAEPRPRLPRADHQRGEVRGALDRARPGPDQLAPRAAATCASAGARPTDRRSPRPSARASASCCSSAWSARPSAATWRCTFAPRASNARSSSPPTAWSSADPPARSAPPERGQRPLDLADQPALRLRAEPELAHLAPPALQRAELLFGRQRVVLQEDRGRFVPCEALRIAHRRLLAPAAPIAHASRPSPSAHLRPRRRGSALAMDNRPAPGAFPAAIVGRRHS